MPLQIEEDRRRETTPVRKNRTTPEKVGHIASPVAGLPVRKTAETFGLQGRFLSSASQNRLIVQGLAHQTIGGNDPFQAGGTKQIQVGQSSATTQLPRSSPTQYAKSLGYSSRISGLAKKRQ